MAKLHAAAKAPEQAQDELSRKEELLRTGVELFSEHGFKGTSIRDIARSLGISVSNMYHYFETKEDLWLAIQEYSVRWLPVRLEAVWEQSAEPLERFRLLLKVHLESSGIYQKESRIFMMDQDQVSKKGNVKNKQIQKKVLDIYLKHIESLQQAGYLATCQTKILAFNILGVVNWYLRWYKADGALPADAVFDEIINFILYGAIDKARPAVSKRKPT
jgi:AcrR family transcriptional regulator